MRILLFCGVMDGYIRPTISQSKALSKNARNGNPILQLRHDTCIKPWIWDLQNRNFTYSNDDEGRMTGRRVHGIY